MRWRFQYFGRDTICESCFLAGICWKRVFEIVIILKLKHTHTYTYRLYLIEDFLDHCPTFVRWRFQYFGDDAHSQTLLDRALFVSLSSFRKMEIPIFRAWCYFSWQFYLIWELLLAQICWEKVFEILIILKLKHLHRERLYIVFQLFSLYLTCDH